jgi:mono/diheme cytochrome c family protein
MIIRVRTLGAAARHALGIAVAAATFGACAAPPNNPDRAASVDRAPDAPEHFIVDNIQSRPDSLQLVLPSHRFDTDEDAQPDTLPALAFGMTLEQIRDGDRIFHGKGGCEDCHGSEGQGMPARGKTLTAGVQFVPAGDWSAIDSIIEVGVPDKHTRSPIAMPPRGKHSDLDASEARTVAAYVWAISQTRGEPWSGGHDIHTSHDWRASSRTSIP